jgi:hypothetical protein
MGKFIDLTGQRFGRLVVIEKTEERKKYSGNIIWLCECDCGNFTKADTNSLKREHTKSCGCLVVELNRERAKNNRKEYGESSFNSLFNRYKTHAEKRGIAFNLEKEEFRKMTQCDCFYCGEKPNQIVQNRNNFGQYIYNGIDRLNSKEGYTKENCVPCCGRCNEGKNDISQQDFYDWIDRVYHHIHQLENNKQKEI